ncbi:MAG TPA: hypothetical protein VFF73_32530 [Planctomycetota bacterium]|nr:hypothetical protein [Planctomycetota bacterium]
MSTLSHLNAGARGADRLVRDDRDRFRLLQCVTRALGKRVLAYCIMDTHLHVVAEGRTDELVAALRLALRGYARTFNARHASEGPLLRRPVQPIPVPRGVELARAIHYVHKNPLDTHPLWSRARSPTSGAVPGPSSASRA